MKSYRIGIVALLLAAVACGGDDQAALSEETRFEGGEVTTARAGWPEGLAAMVDSGNVAFREGRHEDAAGIFRSATDRYPHIGAPWFGLYMAEHALGNLDAATEALEKSESLTPGLREASRHGGMTVPVDSGPNGGGGEGAPDAPPGH